MATYEIETPDGAVYEIDAESDSQLQATIAQLTGANAAVQPEIAPDPSAGGSTLQFGPWDTGIKTGQGVDRFLSGAGKAFSDIGAGIGQAGANYALRNAPESAQQIADAGFRRAADETKDRDAPLMKTGAGIAGNISGNVAAVAPTAFIPGVNTYTGAAALGGLLGALQPVGTDDSRLVNASLGAGGGVAGKGIGDGLARLAGARPITSASQAAAGVSVGPSQSAASSTVSGGAKVTGRGGGYTFGHVGDDASAGLNSAQQGALTAGREMGMRVTPGTATGSKALQQLEVKLESQPMTSGPFNTIKDANQKVLNRATARAIGETSDTVDASVLAKANDRLGSVFAGVRDETPRAIDPQTFVNKLQGINDEFEGLLPGGKTIAQNPLVQRLFRYAEEGNATGRQLGDLTSKLGRAAHKEMTSGAGDREMGQALYQIKDYVDDLVEQGLTGPTLKTYQQARGQYRNLVNITKQVGVVNPSSGNVSGATLANVLQRSDKKGFLYGQNKTDMYAAARFAQAFKPIVGDSGTATRSALPSPTDFVLSLPFNVATRAYTSSPSVQAAVAAQAAARNSQNAAAPLMLGLAPYTPVVGGLLGANTAR